MGVWTAVAIGLAVISTTLTNVAYLREHDAAASLPSLSMRRPVESLRLLFGDRTCTGVLAAIVLAVGRARGGLAAAEGVAGGLLFSIGDLSTKVATEGGARFLFVITLVIGYTLGSSLLQLGYQRGGTLTVAGLATLCTNALPIIAGTVLLAEPIGAGIFGVLRVAAFCAVVAGAFLLATPDRAAAAAPVRAEAQVDPRGAVPSR